MLTMITFEDLVLESMNGENARNLATIVIMEQSARKILEHFGITGDDDCWQIPDYVDLGTVILTIDLAEEFDDLLLSGSNDELGCIDRIMACGLYLEVLRLIPIMYDVPVVEDKYVASGHAKALLKLMKALV